MTDLFDKFHPEPESFTAGVIEHRGGAAYPEFSGEVDATMSYRGRPCLVWNINNYLGLANHPEVRAADAEYARRWGLAAPMGARIMSGESSELRALEAELAEHTGKPEAVTWASWTGSPTSVADTDSACSSTTPTASGCSAREVPEPVRRLASRTTSTSTSLRSLRRPPASARS